MRIKSLVALASALLIGCDVDFVAIEKTQAGHISVLSEHGPGYEASLEITLVEGSEHPLVRAGGAELPWEEEAGVWRSQLLLAVDTLRPRIELVIQQPVPVILVLPLSARAGAAVRRQNGDLVLPLVHGDLAAEWERSWAVVLTDSMGSPLIRIDSHGAALPGPLVLPADMAPREAVAAEFSAFLHREFESEASYRLTSAINTIVHFSIADPQIAAENADNAEANPASASASPAVDLFPPGS